MNLPKGELNRRPRVLQLYGHPRNPGGIVNFYHKLQVPFQKYAYDIRHFRVGRVQTNRLLSFLPIRILDQILNYFSFVFVCLQTRPDIIHINPTLEKISTPREYVYLRLGRFLNPRVGVITHFRGWDVDLADRFGDPSVFNSIVTDFVRRSNLTIVLATSFKQALQNLLPEYGPIEILPTTLEFFHESGSRPQHDTAELHLLFLGRVIREKGVFDLVDALDRIRQEGSSKRSIQLVIAGDGPDLPALKTHTRELELSDCVSFPGYLRNAAKEKVLRKADLFVFPSYYKEGCPNSVVEAMGVGLPIISTPVGALEDLIADGVNGFLVEAKSPAAIANAIVRLGEDNNLRDLMGAHNLKLARTQLNTPVIAKRIVDYYEKILEDANGQ